MNIEKVIEKLKQDKKLFIQQQNQLQLSYNVLQGKIQQIDEILKMLEEKEDETKREHKS